MKIKEENIIIMLTMFQMIRNIKMFRHNYHSDDDVLLEGVLLVAVPMMMMFLPLSFKFVGFG